jgi:hypothetical protein
MPLHSGHPVPPFFLVHCEATLHISISYLFRMTYACWIPMPDLIYDEPLPLSRTKSGDYHAIILPLPCMRRENWRQISSGIQPSQNNAMLEDCSTSNRSASFVGS